VRAPRLVQPGEYSVRKTGLLASEVAPRSRLVKDAAAIFAAALAQGSQAAAK
jgi:hypothetical protein